MRLHSLDVLCVLGFPGWRLGSPPPLQELLKACFTAAVVAHRACATCNKLLYCLIGGRFETPWASAHDALSAASALSCCMVVLCWQTARYRRALSRLYPTL